jgi:hypothetical protein
LCWFLVLLAAAVSMLRFGGANDFEWRGRGRPAKPKVTDDLSKAELMYLTQPGCRCRGLTGSWRCCTRRTGDGRFTHFVRHSSGRSWSSVGTAAAAGRFASPSCNRRRQQDFSHLQQVRPTAQAALTAQEYMTATPRCS